MRHADVPYGRVQDLRSFGTCQVLGRYAGIGGREGRRFGRRQGVIVCSTSERCKKAIDRVMIQENLAHRRQRQAVVESDSKARNSACWRCVGGRAILPLPPTQDHQGSLDGDKG